jgi:putative ABC transport system permease protein
MRGVAAMRGILRLAYKLLVNDKAKFTALLVGITFAVFLMIQMTAMFAGVLARSSATVLNLGASIWVMDPSVQTVQNTIGMPDFVLDAVRSIEGVDHAAPVFSGGALVKLGDGNYQAATIVGLDDSTLAGRPQLIEGKIEDLYGENAFIAVKDPEFRKLGSPRLGTEFQVNDHRGVVVGVARVASSGLFGMPTLYTTYKRALQYLPIPRYTISYVMVEPKGPDDLPRIKERVAELGFLALSKQEFVDRIIAFYMFQTGVGMNILIMTMMSFVVGLSISGQTFYTFVLENLEKFGALKAIGAKSRELIAMILFQAGFTALTGYGLGIGLCALLITLAKVRLPDYAATITWWNLTIAFVMVVIIATVSSYFGVRRVLRIEPFDIFRG